MVIAKDKGIIFVLLAEGEFLPVNLNSEKVLVMRRGESTGGELKVVKKLGELASEDLIRKLDPPVCNYSGDGNPLHEHLDGTWWFYDETWAFENGPYESYDFGWTALGEYCVTLLKEKDKTLIPVPEEKDLTTISEHDSMETDGIQTHPDGASS